MADSEGSPRVELSSVEPLEELVGALRAVTEEATTMCYFRRIFNYSQSTPDMSYDSFRKHVKNSGTIGKRGQKDKLTFSSLILQIKAVKKKTTKQ
ncbi:hypothetical protein HOLleu_09921 [Holothuria leucospilota]|uniref:Uncharacterized protein n=1 Tax=Holothuria leucospilota TaxID=206669 RepID=A0A9Q1CEE5_HOLLE|nr:hypothetical protein HOLleu_09921 [Holothuria leucospilota]